MTNEQAIKYLQESKCDQKQGHEHQEMHDTALELAIQALEKQIPKKPKKILQAFEYIFGDCPSCNKSSDMNYKHCQHYSKNEIRRRRKCQRCKKRFTTYEIAKECEV